MKLNKDFYTDTNTTYDVVTTTANGLMSSSDKKKIDTVQQYMASGNLNDVFNYIGIVNGYEISNKKITNAPITGDSTQCILISCGTGTRAQFFIYKTHIYFRSSTNGSFNNVNWTTIV